MKVVSVGLNVNLVHVKIKANQEDGVEEQTNLLEHSSM